MGEIFENIGTTPNNTGNIGISEGLNIKFISSQYADLVIQWARIIPLLSIGAKFI